MRLGIVVPAGFGDPAALAPSLPAGWSWRAASAAPLPAPTWRCPVAQLTDAAADAAAALAQDCDALAYACTAGSFVHGIDGERRLREALRSAAGGRPVTTTTGALLAALAARRLRRVGLLTPYGPQLDERLVATLTEAGVAVVATGALGAPARLVPEDLLAAARELLPARPQAVVVACTLVPAHRCAPALRAALGVPALWAAAETLTRAAAAAA